MKRFIIAKIGQSSEINYLAPYIHFIHKMTMSVPIETQESSFWTTVFGAGWEGISSEPVAEVSSVYYRLTLLNKVDTYNSLQATPNSFWFDEPNQELNVRVYLDTPTFSMPTKYGYGLTVGLIDNSDFDELGLVDSTIGGIAYHPALISQGMSAMLSVDNLAENKLTMDGFTISINNSSGLFDEARILFYKQRVDLFVADIPEANLLVNTDFKLLRTAIVDNVHYTSDDLCQIEAIDPRQTMDRQVPFSVFTETDFDDPTDSRAIQHIGKVKPLALGNMLFVPTIPLSPSTTLNGSRHFISTTEYGNLISVSTCIEVLDDGLATRDFTVDLTTGVLTITTGTYTGGDIIVAGLGVRFTNAIYGYPYFNTGNEYYNLPQQTAFFFLTKLGYVPDSTNYIDKASFVDSQLANTHCNFYIPVGGANLLDLLDQVSITCNWLMYIEDGLIKAGKSAPASYVTDRLYVDELAEPPAISWDVDAFGTRLNYLYAYSPFFDDFNSYLLKAKEEELVARYRTIEAVTIETPISYKTGAEILAPSRYESISFIPAVLTCQLLELPRWKLLDFVIFDYKMDGRQRLPEMVYRVVGIDPLTNTVILRQYEDTIAMEGSMLNFYRRLNAKGA